MAIFQKIINSFVFVFAAVAFVFWGIAAYTVVFEIIKDSQEKYASFNKFCEENLKEFIPYLNIKNHNHFVREDCYASI